VTNDNRQHDRLLPAPFVWSSGRATQPASSRPYRLSDSALPGPGAERRFCDGAGRPVCDAPLGEQGHDNTMTKPDPSKAIIPILRQRGAERISIDDTLAVEEPLEIQLGYTHARRGRQRKSISVTMRTPGHDEELATGFLFGEGIITAADQIESVDSRRDNIVAIELKDDVPVRLTRLERNFYTTSSCGVCGKATLEALSLQGAEALTDNDFGLPATTLYGLGDTLREHQALFRETGGNHATAAFDAAGNILLVREDVGRHNAMDKLIGRLLSDTRVPLRETGLLVSGRASFELMQKALMAGCPLLAAVGAPSSLAVNLAREYNITLVGFLRQDGFNIFHGAEHIH